jgi:hypothetical protein
MLNGTAQIGIHENGAVARLRHDHCQVRGGG